MIYNLQVEQQALSYIRHVLTQRPYCEVASLIVQLDAQQAAQDAAAAIPIDQLKFGEPTDGTSTRGADVRHRRQRQSAGDDAGRD